MPEVTGSGSSLAQAFRAALAKASLGAARPSYRLQNPVAQYRQLSRTRLGRQALELAGVSPAPRTRARWLGRAQQPSAANTEKIRQAYGAMQRGGIPDWVKRGEMKIQGRTRTGDDDRDRGPDNPLKIRLRYSQDNQPRSPALPTPPPEDPDESYWDHFERRLADDPDDDELEDLISEDLIEPDIGSSDGWEFPGGSYSVGFSG